MNRQMVSKLKELKCNPEVLLPVPTLAAAFQDEVII